MELVWCEAFQFITDAIAAERRIKGWSRAKKEAMMRGDWDQLPPLSRRRGGKPKPINIEQHSEKPTMGDHDDNR